MIKRLRKETSLYAARGICTPVKISIENTAHHEAGHAAMALELGLPITGMTIERTDTMLGSVQTIEEDILLFDSLLFAMAGPAAEYLYEGKPEFMWWSHSDAAHIKTHLRDAEFEKNLKHLLRFLESAPVWAGIQALADALLEKRTIVAGEAKAIYFGAKGSIKDDCHNEAKKNDGDYYYFLQAISKKQE